MWAFIELLSEQDELLDCISVASSPSIGAIEDTSNPPRRPSICLLGMVRQDVVWWLLSSAVFIRKIVYCILTAEPRDLSISRQSTSPQYLLNSYARTLAARGSTRPIAASPSKQNRLVESNVAVAVVGAAPTQLLHRPCQRLLHTHTYTHAREFHGILRTVQPLQILTHTLLLARQLYDFQLPVILPLDSHVG